MTRKDYVMIAQTISNMDECIDSYSLRVLAEAFAIELKEDNARFDRARFLTACGVKEGEE